MPETAPAVRGQIEALLLAPALEPLAASFGEYGSLAVQAFTQALSRLLAGP